MFEKQKHNLISMKLENGKLLPKCFKMFTEKRWERLLYIKFSKFSLIQIKLTSMINVLSFSPNVKCLFWKKCKFIIAK